MKRRAILGISAYYHDSAAVLVEDGRVLAAAQEERFTRQKHDPSFPSNAVRYVLDEGALDLDELSTIAFYDKPFLKLERLLETYNGFAPKGLRSFLTAMPVWIKEKMFLKKMLRDELGKFGTLKAPLLFPEHHLSHAASAFYPSPFHDAAILTVDGVGEWATTTICKGEGRHISVLKELHFPHSLGLLYSAFTAYCGFRVNSGEYKLMGLAPYAMASSSRVRDWKRSIEKHMIDVREDGSYLLNMEYFDYATGLRMFHEKNWRTLFGIAPRESETDIVQEYMDMALAVQQVVEEVVLRLAKTARESTGCPRLVMAGGVALNCVANGKLLNSGLFDDIWIQPASGDAGGALGAALAAHHIWCLAERVPEFPDGMRGAYLGPSYQSRDVEKVIRRYGAQALRYDDFSCLCREVAGMLADGEVVGWFQGRMEFGPRALGARSILGDPRKPEMQKKLNLKIKFREGFRPFAPSVLEESTTDYFDLKCRSPYMLFVAPVTSHERSPVPEDYPMLPMYERLYFKRSSIPAVTHVDFSARIQTVSKETNPRYWELIRTFQKREKCGLLVNTSFNVRGEPIVCTPEDAYRCFMNTEMDCLVIDDYVFIKSEQPDYAVEENWINNFKKD
jgi:carbamoyltransferase